MVALRSGDGEPLEARDDPPAGERPRHTTRLLGLARELLARAAIGFPDLDRVAVGIGPGSFTGLRVGVASARALAQAAGAELAGISSLRALALGAEHEAGPGTTVLAVIDARRGETFAAAWRDGEPVLEAAPRAPDVLAATIAERGWLAVGDGALRYTGVLAGAGAEIPDPGSPLHLIRGAALLELGAAADPTPREALVPDYLRRPDAEARFGGSPS